MTVLSMRECGGGVVHDNCEAAIGSRLTVMVHCNKNRCFHVNAVPRKGIAMLLVLRRLAAMAASGQGMRR